MLPKNGDESITECYNCEMEFEDTQKIGSWVKCDEEEGGCGITFKLIIKTGKLETL